MLGKFFNKKAEKNRHADKWIFGTMLFFGLCGLIASFVLTIDTFQLLEHPNSVLSCDFNPFLSCSTVMQTWQSSLFGFPNMIIGLMAFSAVVTIAVIGLIGVKFPRRFLVIINFGYLLGLIFAYWLFFQSVYSIQVLCPWCLVVTFSTTIIFETLTRYNLRENIFGVSKKTQKKIDNFLIQGYDKLIVVGWLVLMVCLVFLKFGDSLV